MEAILRRDRRVVLAGLFLVIALSWIYLLTGAGMEMNAFEMSAMSGGAGAMTMAEAAMTPAAWTPGYALLMVSMWWIMMLAMMLPSASPMILLYAAVNRKEGTRGKPVVPTWLFAAGYIAAWGGFSALAAGLQWGLEQSALLSSMMVSTSAVLGGVLLVAAGLWQLTPLKRACLKHCRAPVDFLARHWRPGRWGAFRMGLHHGVFCLGCCWVLMGLLFYGGVMNLYWIAGLAVFVLLEKTLPAGEGLGRLAGLALLSSGGWLLATAV